MEKSKRSLYSEKIYLRRSGLAFCPLCGKTVELLSFETSAQLFKTDVQDIEYLARSGYLHRVHNKHGNVMICSLSLYRCFESRRTRLLDSHFTEVSKLGN